VHGRVPDVLVQLFLCRKYKHVTAKRVSAIRVAGRAFPENLKIVRNLVTMTNEHEKDEV